MRIRSRITINYPIEKVFALTANLDQPGEWFTQANPLRSEIRWVFNAVESETRVTVTVHAETFWLVGLFIAPSAKKALAKQLTRVKKQLEAS